jgi:hypothetical protein
MKTAARLAAAALVTAAALAPGLAAADGWGERWEHDRGAPGRAWDHDGRREELLDGRFDDRFDDRFDHRGPGRPGGWEQARAARHQRIREVRFELRRLDDDRAAFHARFAWRPRKLARYDAWYFDQRAVLERELARLTWYARR